MSFIVPETHLLSLTIISRHLVLSPIALYCLLQFFRRSIPLRILARTFMILQVCIHYAIPLLGWQCLLDGGWLKSHPLPADKSSFGAFEALAQENKEIIKSILESTSSVSPTDDRILTKLRDFYGSCLNEDRLNDVAAAPLLHLVKTIKLLYSGNSTSITRNVQSDEDKVKGLTTAVAFLHSRGILIQFFLRVYSSISCASGIPALFTFDIEGDVGVDPNHMVLWFSQPELGLPSKASEEFISLFPDSNQISRNTSKRNRSAIFMRMFWNDCSLLLSKKMKYNSKRCVHPSWPVMKTPMSGLHGLGRRGVETTMKAMMINQSIKPLKLIDLRRR